jgi:4-carboxymuconolactone decarboxylase
MTSTANRPPLNIRGHRSAPLTWETMNPEQVAMAENVMAGKRGSMQGPYNVLMRSPALGNLAQQFGEHTRFNASLPLALNELVILLVARSWSSQFVWWARKRNALDAGWDAALVDAIAHGQVPDREPPLPANVAAMYNFAHELQQKKTGERCHPRRPGRPLWRARRGGRNGHDQLLHPGQHVFEC